MDFVNVTSKFIRIFFSKKLLLIEKLAKIVVIKLLKMGRLFFGALTL